MSAGRTGVCVLSITTEQTELGARIWCLNSFWIKVCVIDALLFPLNIQIGKMILLIKSLYNLIRGPHLEEEMRQEMTWLIISCFLLRTQFYTKYSFSWTGRLGLMMLVFLSDLSDLSLIFVSPSFTYVQWSMWSNTVHTHLNLTIAV